MRHNFDLADDVVIYTIAGRLSQQALHQSNVVWQSLDKLKPQLVDFLLQRVACHWLALSRRLEESVAKLSSSFFQSIRIGVRRR